ncbi:MAG: hypothetical protein JXR76_22040 [Deltaproteobacteria bacterium]|nr:hypothetical protein [Deltaproteobacteria bacterium]
MNDMSVIKKRLSLIAATLLQLFALALAALATFYYVREQGRGDAIVTVSVGIGGIGVLLCLVATWWLDLTQRVSRWVFLGAPLLCNLWAMLIPYIFGGQFFSEVAVHNHFGFPVDWYFYGDALHVVGGQSIALIWAATAIFSVVVLSRTTLVHLFDWQPPRFFRSGATYCFGLFGVVLWGVMILANRPYEIESVSHFVGHWLTTLFYPQQGGGFLAWRQLLWVIFLFQFFFGHLFVQPKSTLLNGADNYQSVSIVAMFGLLICLFDAGRSMFAAAVMRSTVEPLMSSLTWFVFGETPWFVYATIFHVAALLIIGMSVVGVVLFRRNRHGDGFRLQTVLFGVALFLLPVVGREAWGIAAMRATAGEHNSDTALGDVGRFAARVPITFENEPGQPVFSLYDKNIDLPKVEYGLQAVLMQDNPVFLSLVDSQIYVNQTPVASLERLPGALKDARADFQSHVQQHTVFRNWDTFRLRTYYELDGAIEYRSLGTAFLLADSKTPATRIRKIFELCVKERLEVRLVGLSRSSKKDAWYIQKATRPLRFVRATPRQKHSGFTHFRFEGTKIYVTRFAKGNSTTTLQKLKEQLERCEGPREAAPRLVSFSDDISYGQLLAGISFLNEGFGTDNIELWVNIDP